MKAIYIYGVSGHGMVVADVARACGYDEIVLIDDRDSAYPSLKGKHQVNPTPQQSKHRTLSHETYYA